MNTTSPYGLTVSNTVLPAAASFRGGGYGYAVRCIAAAPEPKTFTITYDCNAGSGYSCTMNPATQTCTTDADQCTTTLSSNQPTHTCANWSLLGWDTNKNASSPAYAVGSDITLSGDMTLYGIWYTSGNTCAV